MDFSTCQYLAHQKQIENNNSVGTFFFPTENSERERVGAEAYSTKCSSRFHHGPKHKASIVTKIFRTLAILNKFKLILSATICPVYICPLK